MQSDNCVLQLLLPLSARYFTETFSYILEEDVRETLKCCVLCVSGVCCTVYIGSALEENLFLAHISIKIELAE